MRANLGVRWTYTHDRWFRRYVVESLDRTSDFLSTLSWHYAHYVNGKKLMPNDGLVQAIKTAWASSKHHE